MTQSIEQSRTTRLIRGAKRAAASVTRSPEIRLDPDRVLWSSVSQFPSGSYASTACFIRKSWWQLQRRYSHQMVQAIIARFWRRCRCDKPRFAG
jgi:hypothetical protein